jgi:nucleotide-binding universal stress UspA family protein
MKILIGTDGSKFSEAAVQAVIRWFAPPGNSVKVLHVIEPIAYTAPPQMASGYAPEEEGEAKLARELVEAAAKKLRSAGFAVDLAVERGDPREVIIDNAADWYADLIVIGAHGRKEIQRFLMGNVAEHVARHAARSVLVVRTPE